jgi:hypothetical protein
MKPCICGNPFALRGNNVNVTKKSTSSTAAGVTKASNGVTMLNCEGSTVTAFPPDGSRILWKSRIAASSGSRT